MTGWRSLAMAGAVAANLGLNFLFQIRALQVLGAGTASDALFIGMTMPTVLLALLTPMAAATVLPALGRAEAAARPALAATHGLWISALSAVLALILTLTAPWWLPLLVPGLGPAGRALAVELALIQTPAMACNGLLLAGWLAAQAAGRALRGEAATLAVALAAVLLVDPVAERFAVTGLAWLFTAKALIAALALLPLASWARPAAAAVWAAARKTWGEGRGLLGAAVLGQAAVLLDRVLLSAQPAGVLSLYLLVLALAMAVANLLERSLVAPRLAGLAAAWGEGRGLGGARRMLVLTAAGGGLASAGALGGAALLAAGWPAWLMAEIATAVPEASLRALLPWLGVAAAPLLLLAGLASALLASAAACGEVRAAGRIQVAGTGLGLVARVGLALPFGAPGLLLAAALAPLITALGAARLVWRTCQSR